MSVQTPFGLLGSRIVGPAEVASGLACGCYCPGCGAQLIARKGSRAWCFAHHQMAGSRACLETAIHAAGKQALLDAGHLMVPGFRIEKHAVVAGQTFSAERTLGVPRRIRCERMVTEVNMDGVRPDVVGYRGPRVLILEVFVTHRVDADKLAKLSALGHPVLEIDLSDLPALGLELGLDVVRRRTIDDTSHKTWLVFPGQVTALAQVEEELARQVTAAEAEANRLASARSQQMLAQKRERIRRTAAREAHLMQEAAQQVAAQRAYRELSLAQKELRLRRALNLQDEWPDHLSDARFHTPGLGLPCHLWQGLFFEHFILRRKGGSDGFPTTDFDPWARAWVGVVNDGAGRADSALRAFADSLFQLGFLDRYRPIDPRAIIHYGVPSSRAASELLPPSPTKVSKQTMPLWQWRERWPRAEEILLAAEQLLCNSPHQLVLLFELDELGKSTVPPLPESFAAKLAEQGVPQKLTLDVLVALRLTVRIA